MASKQARDGTTPAGVVSISTTPHLYDLIRMVSNRLASRSLADTGSVSLRVTQSAHRYFHAPPLYPCLRLGDIDLNYLTCALYCHTTYNEQGLLEAWQRIVNALQSRAASDVLAEVEKAFPRLPTMSATTPPVTAATYYLGAAAWHLGTLVPDRDPRVVQVQMPGLTIGFDRQILLTSSGARVASKMARLPDARELKASLNNAKRTTSTAFLGLLDHLLKLYPLLRRHINTVAQVVVWAGPEFEQRLGEFFDIEVDVDSKLEPLQRATWDQLDQVARSGSPDTVKVLARHLLPGLGKVRFTSLFGSPYYSPLKPGSPRLIKKYLDGLAALRAEGFVIASAVPPRKSNPTVSAELAELLQLQQRIGGIR